jgi:hypothetical protein
MTVKELAMRYRTSRTAVYSALYDIETKKGKLFERVAGRLKLTGRELDLLKQELEKRGLQES